jgi:hypothetical protein
MSSQPRLDKRPVAGDATGAGAKVQSEDVSNLIRHIASLPPHVFIKETMITSAWNRGYFAELESDA